MSTGIFFLAKNCVCGNAFPDGKCSVTVAKARHTRYVTFPFKACHVAGLAGPHIIHYGHLDLPYFLGSANIAVTLIYEFHL